MKTFTLTLLDSTHSEVIDNVTSFVGEDASGWFGILAGHARFVTALLVGLAKFEIGKDKWRYLALPGAVLNFDNNMLTISTRRYLLDDDYNRITQAIREQLLVEENKLLAIKESLGRMEQELLRYLWEIGRRTGA